jgi:hypothetical protein
MTEPRKHEKYDALIDSCHALAPLTCQHAFLA